MLKTPPDLTALNTMVGGTLRFSFTDNPDWRSKLTSITWSNSLGTNFGDLATFDRNTPGLLNHNYVSYGTTGTWVWTFKATGYADAIVTVIVR